VTHSFNPRDRHPKHNSTSTRMISNVRDLRYRCRNSYKNVLSYLIVEERSRSDAACVASWRRWYALYAWETKSPPTSKLGSNDNLSSSKKMPGTIRMSMVSRQPWDVIRECLMSSLAYHKPRSLLSLATAPHYFRMLSALSSFGLAL
jgi:hypothetical protein